MSNHVGSIQIGIPNIYLCVLARSVFPMPFCLSNLNTIPYILQVVYLVCIRLSCLSLCLLQVRVCMYVLRPDQSVFWISSDSLSRSVGLWRLIYLSRPLCLYYGNLYGCPDLSILRRLICFSVQIFLFYGDLSICPDLTVLWRSFSMSVHFGLSIEIA
jgi:hypothetical protein